MKISTKFLRSLKIVVGLFAVPFAGSEVHGQYCTPNYTAGCTSQDDINTVTLTAANATSINQTATGCSSGGYIYYSSIPTVTVITGNTYTGTVNSEYSSSENLSIWIDFNNNGTFESTERVGTLANFGSTLTNYTITIPANATTGMNLRMRYRLGYSTVPTTMDPCTNIYYGETHDYNVNVLPPAPPNNAGVTSLVTPDSVPKCSNTTQQVSVAVMNLGSNALTSANINWSVNGVLQTPLTLPVALPNYKDSTVVVLGNVFFPTTAPIQLKAWTDSPNGVADAIPADDTLTTNMAMALQGVVVNIVPHDTIICAGNEITLDAGSDHPVNPVYIWSTSKITSTIKVSQAGYYSVWIQNADGCIGRDTATVAVHPDPVVNSIAIIDNQDGSYKFNVIGAQNITSYTWDFGDTVENFNGTPGEITHYYTTAGDYTVVLTLRNDCGEITVTKLITTSGSGTTGVNEVSGLQKTVTVFPNPSSSKITISNSDKLMLQSVGIYNLLGQQVYKADKVNASKYSIDISNLAVGMYNVVIDTDAGKVTKKLNVVR